MTTLRAGLPGVLSVGGAQGPSIVKSTPELPSEKVIAAGSPGVITFVGIAGVTLNKTPAYVPDPITLEVVLERKRVPLTLASRSLDAELSRKRLKMEVKG